MSEDLAQRFNEGKPDWTLLDFQSLRPLVDVMTFGEKKYGRFNWKKKCPDINQHIQSAFRHLTAISDGEDLDKESELLHAGHVMANMMMYIYHYNKQKIDETKD